jgi:pyrimidine deaminase RibD-like protein
MTPDERFMAQALALAKRAYGQTSPNPMVGAVVVQDGEVIGRGWHHRAGAPHAEIEALADAARRQRSVSGATIYVTLEPCVMCAGALAWSQIGRVVYAASDEKRGIMLFGGKDLLHPKTKLEMGIMEEECGALMTAFFRGKRG